MCSLAYWPLYTGIVTDCKFLSISISMTYNFPLFSFNLFVPFYLMWVYFRQDIVRFCFLSSLMNGNIKQCPCEFIVLFFLILWVLILLASDFLKHMLIWRLKLGAGLSLQIFSFLHVAFSFLVLCPENSSQFSLLDFQLHFLNIFNAGRLPGNNLACPWIVIWNLFQGSKLGPLLGLPF